MRFQLNWRTSVLIWLVYNVIIYATWATVGADYSDMVRREVIFERVVLPEISGMIFLVIMLTLSGALRPVMREALPGRPRWLLQLLSLPIAFFVFTLVVFTEWAQIERSHVLLLLIGAAIVGFNEEALIRGIAVIGLRSVFRRGVRFGSSRHLCLG